MKDSIPSRRMVGLVAALAAVPAIAQAAPESTWVPVMQPTWPAPLRQPTANGVIDGALGGPSPLEYANGVLVPINNFSATGKNGSLLLTASGRATFGADCIQTDGSACKGSQLSAAFKVAAMGGSESGSLTFYLDAKRVATLAAESCLVNGVGTAKPGPEDRKIVIAYQITETLSFGVVKRTVKVTDEKQYAGTCSGWSAPLAADSLARWDATVKLGLENGADKWLVAEAAITLRPRLSFAIATHPLSEELVGFAVKRGAGVVGVASGFPSIFNHPPLDLDVTTWQTLDFHAPTPEKLSFAIYNAGQLSVSGDGGQGEAVDIAGAVNGVDVACVVEMMEAGHREDLVDEVNALRPGLPAIHAYYPPDGSAPNNMILSTHPIVAADYIRYGDLPGNDGCYADECLMSGVGGGPGWKGIVWARIAVNGKAATPGGAFGPAKSETIAADDFIDVFCTHTQADYNSDGEHHEHREFDDLKAWSDEKRAGGGLIKNGLDRPAILLGDMNQMGPKRIDPADHANGIIAWAAAHSDDEAMWANYDSMNHQLGIAGPTAFDSANSYAFDLYDVSALAQWGTWITEEPETNISDTIADECTASYPTPETMENVARVDYVIALPAQVDGLPTFVLVGDPSSGVFPGAPTVSVDIHAGNWTDGAGCISDHAQVTATVGLLRTTSVLKFNPLKTHRVTYQVAELTDLHDADDGTADWYIPANGFQMHHYPGPGAASDAAFVSGSDWSEDDNTEDGQTITPTHWTTAMAATGSQWIETVLLVRDHDDGPDDTYDLTSYEPGVNWTRLRFDHTYPGSVWHIDVWNNNKVLAGTVNPSNLDPEGRCAGGCYTVSEGNGDAGSDDGRVTQLLLIQEQ